MLQGCQHKVVTICYIKHVTDLSEQPCNKSDNFDKVVTSCQQVVPKRLTTCHKQCEDNLLTACWQTCYKMWDFCVFSSILFVWFQACIADLKCVLQSSRFLLKFSYTYIGFCDVVFLCGKIVALQSLYNESILKSADLRSSTFSLILVSSCCSLAWSWPRLFESSRKESLRFVFLS
jgi:hypothetical protein